MVRTTVEASSSIEYVRALAELSALPASSIGTPPPEALDGFLRVVQGVLRADLVYARVDDLRFERMFEAARGARGAEARAAEIGRALAPMLRVAACTAAPPSLGEALRMVVVPLTSGGGALAALSRRADFPTELESMLLRAALNHLMLWILLTRSTLDNVRIQERLAETESNHTQLEDENAYLRDEVKATLAFGGIVGQSQALRDILAEVQLVAPTDATVLILGESGTGKELLAREIHERSRRADRPLIKVNCSAIPREMFESEFFGHVRGAFTGAVRDRPGRFQLAERGTIFLDEVGDLPLDLQPKLLRVLQEGQYERVGDDVTRSVDVRVIAATNRDLSAEVGAGRFREDLFYRLSVFPVRIPPLRARKEDIVPLAAHFVALVAKELGDVPPLIGEQQRAVLRGYDWPGNVRELENVIERAVILSRGGELRIDQVLLGRTAEDQRCRTPPPPPRPPDEIVSDQEWRRRERANLMAALARTSGRIYGASGAALLLGVKPSTLQSRLRALGIRARERV